MFSSLVVDSTNFENYAQLSNWIISPGFLGVNIFHMSWTTTEWCVKGMVFGNLWHPLQGEFLTKWLQGEIMAEEIYPFSGFPWDERYIFPTYMVDLYGFFL